MRCSVAMAATDDGHFCGPEYIRILHSKTSRRLNSSSHQISSVNTWYRYVQKLFVHSGESSPLFEEVLGYTGIIPLIGIFPTSKRGKAATLIITRIYDHLAQYTMYLSVYNYQVIIMVVHS